MMTLGSYTFAKNPLDDVAVIQKQPLIAHVRTYSSVAVFDWGATAVGEIVELPWSLMPAAQFTALRALVDAGGAYSFDPETGSTYTVVILSFLGKYRFGVSDAYDKKDVTMRLLILEQLT